MKRAILCITSNYYTCLLLIINTFKCYSYINPDTSKAVSFTKARVVERIRYYFGEQLMPEALGYPD
jgi:hypothetical protein